MADVYLTSQLETYLKSIGIKPAEFRAEFEWWVEDWPAREYSSSLFGKDSAYIEPKVDGQSYSLRHVHLSPMESAAASLWEAIFRRKGRKISDRHLVYYYRSDDAYLLIHILDEPTAHEIASMKTSEDKALMKTFALIAENFEIEGEIP